MDQEMLEEMIKCFMDADKPELVTYLSYMVEMCVTDDVYDDTECYDEDVETDVDDDGFYSLQ
tara:strand:- start:1803 stop:1988 length:186 start_codon:yes stop_codon:yes gene_type:complete